MNDLEQLLPTQALTTPSGSEWVLSFHDAKMAIGIASQNLIAVLGVELFRILKDGLGVEDYSGYGFDNDPDWAGYVARNNEAAQLWLRERQRGSEYGYILTSTSPRESNALSPAQ